MAVRQENRIIVKFPTLGRGFGPLVKWLDAADAGTPTAFIIITDEADRTTDPEELFAIEEDYPHFQFARVSLLGKTTKVMAYNADAGLLHAMNWRVLIGGSDDMVPAPGYNTFCLRETPLDGILWLPTEDPAKKNVIRNGKPLKIGSRDYFKYWISMLPIMGREYYHRFGYIYHPSYQGYFCDNEYTDVARREMAIKWIDNRAMFRHMHPDWEPAEMIARDGTYKKYPRTVFARDRQNYLRRKQLNFPTP
jgi:hypothetical protein